MISPQHRQCAAHLQPLLQHQFDHISSYIDYLDRIKQTITAGDIEALHPLLSENPIDLAMIEQHRKQVFALLPIYQFDGTEQGLQDCLQALKNPSLTKLNESLEKQMKQLEKSLLINDLLIRKNQERVQKSIQILSGHGISGESATYSRQGLSKPSDKNKRTLALA